MNYLISYLCLFNISLLSFETKGASEDAPEEAVVHMDLTTPQTTNATTPRTEADPPREHYDNGDLHDGSQVSTTRDDPRDLQRIGSVAMATAAQEEGRFESRHVSQFIACILLCNRK